MRRRSKVALAAGLPVGVLVVIGTSGYLYAMREPDPHPTRHRVVTYDGPGPQAKDLRLCAHRANTGSDQPCTTLEAKFETSWSGMDADDNSQYFASHVTGGRPTTYLWRFGDGTTGDQERAVHRYAEPGVYEVTLVVTSASGAIDSTMREVVVNPVSFYAPEVHFHPDEHSWPMDPEDFVAHSSLVWAHDSGCQDDVVATTGNVDASRLAAGGYTHFTEDGLCRPNGDLWSTADLTAPARGDDRTRLVDSDEGFYLQLDDAYLRGNEPPDGAEIYSNAPPLYYSFVRARYIVYWFFYGMNSRTLDQHQGDWERMIVRLNGDNRAIEAAYYQHYCQPLADKSRFGHYSWDQMLDNDYLVDGSHPTAWSALGGHPTYPADVGFVDFPCVHRGGVGDRTASGGVIWRTWEGPLRNVDEQAWAGSGVGWGAGGGPLGPGGAMARSGGPQAPTDW